MSRSKRKWDHIKLALDTEQLNKTGLSDVSFVHQSIPEASVDSINIETKVGELVLSSPIFINAMTGGGGVKTQEINGQLAQVAKDTGLGMAVGSQMAAIKSREERPSFEIVREINPDGVILANLGSEASVEQAVTAVNMIDADALQIHLNVVQELAMPEGDRNFCGMLSRIEKIIDHVDTPVIVKETGFGMSYDTVDALLAVGVSAVDIGGYGGTNFAAIENRRGNTPMPFLEALGVPTAASIVEARSVCSNLPIIASGGIQSSYDIAKAVALGADAVAIAGRILRVLMDDGPEGVIEELNQIHAELMIIMTALGAKTIAELKNAPLIIAGDTWHRLEQRGINTKAYSLRKK